MLAVYKQQQQKQQPGVFVSLHWNSFQMIYKYALEVTSGKVIILSLTWQQFQVMFN